MNQDMLNRIDAINQTCENIDETIKLNMPLVERLESMRIKMENKAIPKSGRKVALSKQDYEKQYRAGIVRCMGIDIVWI